MPPRFALLSGRRNTKPSVPLNNEASYSDGEKRDLEKLFGPDGVILAEAIVNETGLKMLVSTRDK